MPLPQNYAALTALWPTLSGAGISDKLAAVNSTQAGEDLWPKANGWQGPINQNDLVAAGIITDDQRKAWEANPS